MTTLSRSRRLFRLLSFPIYYGWAIVSGALRISWDVLHPRPRLAPILVRVPLEPLSPRQRLLLANLITMTPGTLAVDLVAEGSTLLVHGLYDRDHPQQLIATIQNKYQPVISGLPI